MYYSTLGVTIHATEEEIKRSYRQLALQHHPDKAGEAGVERFKQIQEAYATLSNPQKRRLYDLYGEEGMKVFESNEFMSDISGVLLDPRVAIGFAAALGLLLGVLFVGFPALLALKVDGHLAWNWLAVFSPVLLAELLALALVAAVVVAVRFGSAGDNGGPRHGAAPYALLFGTLMWTTFTVLFGLALQGVLRPWLVAFTPLFLCELFTLVTLPVQLKRSTYDAQISARRKLEASMGMESDESSEPSYREYVYHAVSSTTWRSVQLLFLVLKLDHVLGRMSWYVTFLPLWAMLALSVAGVLLKQWRRSGVGPELVCLAVVVTLAFGVCFAFLFMLVKKLSDLEAGRVGIRLAFLLIPVYVVFGILACCVGVVLPLVIRSRFRQFQAQVDEDSNGDIERPCLGKGNRNNNSSSSSSATVPATSSTSTPATSGGATSSSANAVPRTSISVDID